MNQLTLQWTEAGEVKTQSIDDRLPQKIGRDRAQCDIVFSDLYRENHTISRLHVEIFFKPEWNLF
ncbi:MAG: FHA domain-containing protein, partial [Okeania sp. SIO2H7]|nr:FHA domain-containing protein [Okeania sp. SIO2H7]